MSTIFSIPTALIGKRAFDVNGFIAGKGFTVTQRDRNSDTWTITCSEDLTVPELAILRVDIFKELIGIESFKSLFTHNVVQARRAAQFDFTSAWVDVTLDNTDIETDPTVVEHNNTNTDDTDLKLPGLYRMDFKVDPESPEQSNDMARIQGRVRIGDSLVIPGSFAETNIVNDSSLDEFEMLDNQLVGWCHYVSPGSEKVTLQLQKVDLGGSNMNIDTNNITFTVAFEGTG